MNENDYLNMLQESVSDQDKKKSNDSGMSDIKPRTHPSARGGVRAAYGWKLRKRWDKNAPNRKLKYKKLKESLNNIFKG